MFPIFKDIGIVGGAGPEAGILLAKLIIKISQEHYRCKKDQDFPYIGLFSFPFADMLEREDQAAVSFQLKALIQNECSQTKFWAIACNTLHCYLDSIELPNTCVNMLRETAKAISERPIVLCSSTSKKHEVHKRYFECDYPDGSLQEEIDQLIDRLVAEEPTQDAYNQFEMLVKPFEKRVIVLGCTEFSLLHSFFVDKKNIIDPLKITAEKLCALHFGKNHDRLTTY